MADPALQFAALIGSRICHDLISPIGAISNGLELLQLSGTRAGPEMDLIGESVSSASARIRLFRLAFGAAGNQMVGSAEAASIVGDAYEGSRHTVAWDCAEPQPRVDVRLACLGIMCVETAMPLGGAIRVTSDKGKWVVVGKADKIAVDTGLWDMLRGQATGADIQPSLVQFALLPAHAGQTDRPIDYTHNEGEIRIVF